ncbi:Hsp20/alpha crystallin family protein [Luteolibacter sp. LG18]|uniref:Hsp20/alpha crystallin family protein n=1 Tax=Luteolibacter sp. LG18 TaxID=2819286 RepID=UPI002B2AE78E|nr:heat-shock protein Hsp20 [Luteolibacter sp. LG18]
MKHALSAWSPLRELEDFQNRILRAFHPVSRDVSQESGHSGWTPLVDISEDDDSYRLAVDLPQIQREDVKVTVENGVLTISGERKFSKEDGNAKYHRIERGYGSFVRSFGLPPDAASSGIEAKFADGVLQIRVQKNENSKPKQIEVKVD